MCKVREYICLVHLQRNEYTRRGEEKKGRGRKSRRWWKKRMTMKKLKILNLFEKKYKKLHNLKAQFFLASVRLYAPVLRANV